MLKRGNRFAAHLVANLRIGRVQPAERFTTRIRHRHVEPLDDVRPLELEEPPRGVAEADEEQRRHRRKTRAEINRSDEEKRAAAEIAVGPEPDEEQGNESEDNEISGQVDRDPGQCFDPAIGWSFRQRAESPASG